MAKKSVNPVNALSQCVPSDLHKNWGKERKAGKESITDTEERDPVLADVVNGFAEIQTPDTWCVSRWLGHSNDSSFDQGAVASGAFRQLVWIKLRACLELNVSISRR